MCHDCPSGKFLSNGQRSVPKQKRRLGRRSGRTILADGTWSQPQPCPSRLGRSENPQKGTSNRRPNLDSFHAHVEFLDLTIDHFIQVGILGQYRRRGITSGKVSPRRFSLLPRLLLPLIIHRIRPLMQILLVVNSGPIEIRWMETIRVNLGPRATTSPSPAMTAASSHSFERRPNNAQRSIPRGDDNTRSARQLSVGEVLKNGRHQDSVTTTLPAGENNKRLEMAVRPVR